MLLHCIRECWCLYICVYFVNQIYSSYYLNLAQHANQTKPEKRYKTEQQSKGKSLNRIVLVMLCTMQKKSQSSNKITNKRDHELNHAHPSFSILLHSTATSTETLLPPQTIITTRLSGFRSGTSCFNFDCKDEEGGVSSGSDSLEDRSSP